MLLTAASFYFSIICIIIMLSFVPEDAEDDAKSLTKTKAHIIQM